MLGDAVTPEVAAAWSEVYWLFALQLVAEEARLYLQANIDPTQPTRPYRVVRRIEETADVITLVLEPTDGRPLPAIAPGQYVSVFVDTARRRAATSPVLGREIDDFSSYAWYESVDEGDTRSRHGFMDLTDIPLPDDIQVFTCGPLPFMKLVRSTLLSRGVPAARIRYEVFGPDLWAAQTSPDTGELTEIVDSAERPAVGESPGDGG